MSAFQQWEEWVNVSLGACLIVSPYLLGFSGFTSGLLNQIIVGLVVAILAPWAVMTTTEPQALADDLEAVPNDRFSRRLRAR